LQRRHAFFLPEKSVKKHLRTCLQRLSSGMTTTTLKATHRGTCQVCGRAQAHFKGTIAKHGYTVDWGFFNGVCRGAEAMPLEQEKTITERIIAELRNDVAPRADKLANDLRFGHVLPRYTRRVRGELVTCEPAALMPWEIDQCLRRDIANACSEARAARSHADMLEKLIASRHGQPLMPIVLHKELKAGMHVQLGGKKGVLCECIELTRQVARGCGPYMNGRLLPHAMLRRPDGRIVAVPTQTIRQAAIVEGGAQ
jgi:hypothetical protein